jgi:hypothetical protein
MKDSMRTLGGFQHMIESFSQKGLKSAQDSRFRMREGKPIIYYFAS